MEGLRKDDGKEKENIRHAYSLLSIESREKRASCRRILKTESCGIEIVRGKSWKEMKEYEAQVRTYRCNYVAYGALAS